jgi:hypothetical protein
MPPSVLAMYDYETVQKDGKKVVIINSNTDSVLPVVLAHRSSTDCIFVTSGGMFVSYPELMDNETTFLPLSHPRSSVIHAFTKQEYKVELRNKWSTPCENKCPTLWCHLDNGLTIIWSNGLVPTEITQGEDLQWRLTSHCANLACWNNIFKDCDPNSGACAKYCLNICIAKSQSRNARDFNLGYLKSPDFTYN